MKTNIFYKVAAVTNSSPKLGGESRYSIRRKASVLCTLCAVLLLASCTQDDIAPAYNDAPLTVTATIPGDVWAVATRAEGESTVTYSDWTLHYTDYTGAAAKGTLTATPSQDGTYTLTSGSDLVWAMVVQDTQDADETFCLTCVGSDGVTYYATTTAAHGAQAVAFNDAMTPTLAKITVNFTLSHNMATAPSADDFDVTIDAKMKADSYDPMTHGGTWPAADGDAATTAFTLSQQSAATYTYTVTSSMLLPQQDLGNTMTVEYKETTWTLDLSAVAVTGGVEGQKANQLIAGQHLTLNLSTSIHTVGAPGDIRIEAFTAADAGSYTPDLGGVPKTYEYDPDNNTYYIYHEKFIEAAWADRAANDPDAAVVSKIPTLAIVDGAEEDLAIVQAAIAGKTTIYVMGTELAAYDNNNYQTVVRNAISLLEEGTTVSLVMPEVTTIGDYAFSYCSALTSVSLPSATTIGKQAFMSCTALTSVSAPSATTIGNSAFSYCSALASVSLPKATTIGNSAFSYCSALASVSLPKVTTIGKNAFAYCTNLASVSLPKVTTIGNYAFNNCSVLTSLTFGAVITSVGWGTFDNVPLKGCDLTLAVGQQHIDTSTGTPNGTPVTAADASATNEALTWAGNIWKSITLK